MDSQNTKHKFEQCDEFIKETLAERFWGIIHLLPYYKQARCIGGRMKKNFTKAADYSRSIIWLTVSTASVLFLPLFLDQTIRNAGGL